MNVILLGSVVCVVVAIAAVVTMLVRPRRPNRTPLSVADLQARLAEEDERLHPDVVERAAPEELGRSA
ncbi:hypothetical protein [Nocardia vinacea]|uniref:hypothetical protein n=1 Tax=Nocardia vinacea TaxID=96468 RepID=UPI00030D3FF7|nr:hypothetical protein [Nocardia vinacea]